MGYGHLTERVKNGWGTQLPSHVNLPYRCIKLFSYVGDVVFDPFLGSGTTLIEAQNNDRFGVGVEIDRGYCELAQKQDNE